MVRDAVVATDVPRSVDAGMRPIDAGVDGGVQLFEAPSEGCGCRAGAPTQRFGLLALVAGALAVRRRKRRRA